MDEQQRELERRVSAGDLGAAPRLLLARLRAGELSREAIELAGYSGDPVAAEIVTPPEPVQPGEIHWLDRFSHWDRRVRLQVCRAIAEAAHADSPLQRCPCEHLCVLHVPEFGGCVQCSCAKAAPATHPHQEAALAAWDAYADAPTPESATALRSAASRCTPPTAYACFALLGEATFDWVQAVRTAAVALPEDALRRAIQNRLVPYALSGIPVVQSQESVGARSFRGASQRLIFYDEDMLHLRALIAACERLGGSSGISLLAEGGMPTHVAEGHDSQMLWVNHAGATTDAQVHQVNGASFLTLRICRQDVVHASFDPGHTTPADLTAAVRVLGTALERFYTALMTRAYPTLSELHSAVFVDGLGEPDPGLFPHDPALDAVLDDMFGDV